MGLDVARGLAVLGMAGAHMGSTSELVWDDPSTWDALVHGRSAILFAVLAGVSVALMTGRTLVPAREDLPAVRLRLVGRAAAIFAIGLVLELLGTGVAVILTFYGVLFVVAIPFLRWSVRRLAVAAAVLALLGPPLLAALRVLTMTSSGAGVDLILFGTYPVTVWLTLLLAGLALGRLRVDTVKVAVVTTLVGVALAAVGYGAGALLQGTADGAYGSSSSGSSSSSLGDGSTPADGSSSAVPGDASSSLGDLAVPGSDVDLDGLVCDVYDEDWVSCYPADEAVGSSSGPGAEEDWSWLDMLRESDPLPTVLAETAAVFPHSGGVPEVIGSGGFALAVVGLCLLLARPLRWPLLPVAALGSMPLTAYAAHVVVILVLAGGPFGGVASNAAWGWTSLGLLAASTLWALTLGRGPLERLVGRAATAMAGTAGARPAAPPSPSSSPDGATTGSTDGSTDGTTTDGSSRET